MGLYDNWKFRQKVTISNPNTTPLSDFQVKITLDENWGGWDAVAPDGSDIRFSTLDGDTAIPYWVEDWDSANKKATIWVKIPSIPAGTDDGNGNITPGTVDILMWWGNSNATSESDGDAVFDFFDDFEGDSLDVSKWDYQNVVVGNGILKSTADDGFITSKTAPVPAGGGAIVEARVMLNADYDTDLRLTYDSANYIYLRYSTYVSGDYTGHPQLKKMVGGSSSTIAYSFGPQTVKGEWALLRLTKKDSTTYIAYVRNSAGEGSYTATISESVFANNNLRIGWYGQHANDYLDWIRVRKHAPTEPTFTLGEVVSVWLTGWNSRNKITISNSTTSELTDFQIKIELDENWDGWSLAKSDGSDVRITDANGNLLPHWVEEWDAENKKATIWVKIPSIPAGTDDGNGNITPGTADIYLYYNNPDATDTGDPTAVFEWYDDASADNSSSYSLVDLYNSGIHTTISYDAGNKRYEITTGGDTDGIVVSTLTMSNVEILVKGILNPSTTPGKNQQLGALLYSSERAYYLRYETYPSPDTLSIMRQDTPPNTTETKLAEASTGRDVTEDGTVITLLARIHNGNFYLKHIESGTEVTATGTTMSGQPGVFVGYDDGGKIYLILLRVRKYIEPEPTFTIAAREDLIKYYTFSKRVKLQLTADANNEDVELIIDDKFKGFWAHRGVELAVAKDGETVRYPYTINSETTDHISITVHGVTGTTSDVFWLYFDDGQDRDTSHLDDTFAPANLDKKFKLLYTTADPYVIYDVTLTGFGGKLKESDLANLTVVDGNTGTVVSHRVVSYEKDGSGAVTSLRLQVRAAYATDTRTFYLYLVGKGQTFDTPDTYIYPIASAGWALLWEKKNVGVSTSILLDGNSFNVTEYDVGYRRNAYHFDIEEGESYNLPSSNYSRVFRLRLVATDDELSTLHTIMKRPYILVDWLGEEFYGQIIELRYRKDARRPMVYDVELTVERVRVV